MILKIQHFVIFITLIGFISCAEKQRNLERIVANQIAVDSSYRPVDSIDRFVAPFRKRIDQVLDSALAFAPKTISKKDGYYNTSAGNLMADAIYKQSNPIFKSRTKNDIDFVLLNFGGIRSDISIGNVSARTAYEIMPFENTVVVMALSGKSVRKLVDYLIVSKMAHPISKQLQVILDKDGSLKEINIKGKALVPNETYYVATSNYLSNAGDRMDFFLEATEKTEIGYLIRNVMIDYFISVDTLTAAIDNRYYQLN